MALKATIHKADLQIADLDRHYYETHALTIARHPSETEERMMVRVLAFALCAAEGLEFGKGLSTEDEPDLWQRDLTGAIERWIDVGLPDEKRIRRACGRSNQVLVITYGGRVADIWWEQNGAALRKQEKLTVLDLPPEQTTALAARAGRTMSIQATIQEGEVLLVIDGESVNLSPRRRN